ncbi:MAG: leucine-rich repeat domain-containing protein [Clostridia bacterium]|nr:leucine-rich repeat domain-containing protein [Clostridia bacterium]
MLVIFAFIVLAVGMFVSWINSILIFGFGRLIQNSDALVDNSDIIINNSNIEHTDNTDFIPLQNNEMTIHNRRNRLLREEYSEADLPKYTKRKKIFTTIFTSVVCITTVVAILIVALNNPADRYARATDLAEQKKYEEAIEIFKTLGTYKDSQDQIKETLLKMLASGDFSNAEFWAENLNMPDSVYYKKVNDGDLSVLSSHFELTEVELKKIKTISSREFYDCDTLTAVKITDEITTIGEKAFYDCDNLQRITLPATIRYIEEDAFNNCGKLLDIYFLGTTEEWESITKEKNWDKNTGYYIIHCSDESFTK